MKKLSKKQVSEAVANDTVAATETSPMFDHVAQLTGLPQNQISSEMSELLEKVGADPKTATLDDLRRATAALLAEVMGPYEA